MNRYFHAVARSLAVLVFASSALATTPSKRLVYDATFAPNGHPHKALAYPGALPTLWLNIGLVGNVYDPNDPTRTKVVLDENRYRTAARAARDGSRYGDPKYGSPLYIDWLQQIVDVQPNSAMLIDLEEMQFSQTTSARDKIGWHTIVRGWLRAEAPNVKIFSYVGWGPSSDTSYLDNAICCLRGDPKYEASLRDWREKAVKWMRSADAITFGRYPSGGGVMANMGCGYPFDGHTPVYIGDVEIAKAHIKYYRAAWPDKPIYFWTQDDYVSAWTPRKPGESDADYARRLQRPASEREYWIKELDPLVNGWIIWGEYSPGNEKLLERLTGNPPIRQVN